MTNISITENALAVKLEENNNLDTAKLVLRVATGCPVGGKEYPVEGGAIFNVAGVTYLYIHTSNAWTPHYDKLIGECQLHARESIDYVIKVDDDNDWRIVKADHPRRYRTDRGGKLSYAVSDTFWLSLETYLAGLEYEPLPLMVFS